MNKKIVVIGAGPAGIMAALRAKECGSDVTIIEKKNSIANKLRISGKGRCNITNFTDIEGLMNNIPSNPRFLYSCFYTFSNMDIINFFETRGLKTKVERGNRVFPVSDNANDVVKLLLESLKKQNITLLLNTSVIKIDSKNNKITGVLLSNNSRISADSVIIATGGMSYPKTGSTGDGYKLASELGHTIKELKPSLVPLIAKEQWIKELQGLSLKNVQVSFIDKTNSRVVFTDFGEMIFTHFGVSGPIILSASAHLCDKSISNIKLLIDLKPALDEKKLDERIQRDFKKFSNKHFKNSLDELLPQKLIPIVLDLLQIPVDKEVHQISKDERKRLIKILKNFEINLSGVRPIDEAIVTRGGVSTNEINPSTMESKIVKGLFFCGEVMDVDGYTGGFNLTIAFSTGYLAGNNC